MSQPDDTELERYLEGDSPFSRAYQRTRDVEPPASVDEFVLNAARQGEQKRTRRWLPPLAAAAIVVLGITTTLSLLQDEAIISMDDFAAAPPVAEREEALESSRDAAAELRQESAGVRARSESAAAPRPAATAPESPAPLSSNQARGLADSSARRKPGNTADNWIERVRSLRRSGLEDAARREFAAFRSLYPDRPVPEDLQDLDEAIRNER